MWFSVPAQQLKKFMVTRQELFLFVDIVICFAFLTSSFWNTVTRTLKKVKLEASGKTPNPSCFQNDK